MNFDTEEIMDKMGFGADNSAQKVVDQQVIIECDPYVPFDAAGIYANPGRLRDSVNLNTVIGSGEVKYRTPYARYLYYHPEFNYQEEPIRGAYWADRAMQNGGKKRVVEAVKAYIKKRNKK